MAVFPTGWRRVTRLTINSSQVVDNQDNFPVYFDESVLPLEINDPNNDNCSKNNGNDIRFSSDDQGLNQLPVELVDFSYADSGPGSVNLWVLIPNINAIMNTNVYIWYNNIDADPVDINDQYGKYAVWNQNYSNVYHFQEIPFANFGGGFSNRFSNSSQDVMPLLVESAPESYTTLIGNAYTNPDGVDDYPETDSDNNILDFNIGDTLSISYLIKNPTSGTQLTHLSKGHLNNTKVNFAVRQNSNNGLDFLYRKADDSGYAVWRSTLPYLNNLDFVYHITINYTFGNSAGDSFILMEDGSSFILQEDGSSKILTESQSIDNIQLIINGVSFEGSWISGSGFEAPYVADPSEPLIIGVIEEGDEFIEKFDGVLDELRIGFSSFGVSWFQTEYNLYNNLTGFITVNESIDFHYASFIVNKLKAAVPAYITLTDISHLDTSATDYERVWSVTNLETNVTETFTSNTSTYNLKIEGYKGLQYSIQLEAIF